MSEKNLRIINNVYKFLIPIVLIGLGIEIFLVAPQIIGGKQESIDKSEMSKPVNQSDGQATEQTMEGVHYVESKLGEKEWELWADKAYTLKESGQLILETVKVKIFGTGDTNYIVTGSRGEVDINKKDILITGNVVTRTSNGYVMKTDKTFYNSEARTLDSPNEIAMVGPTQKKGDGPIYLIGTGMHAELNDNRIKILKDVKSHKLFSDGRKFTLQSSNATFKSTDYSAFFDENVIIDMQSSRITGDKAILEVAPKTREVYSMTVLGRVKLTDIQRWAVAHEAEMIFPEKKFILRGAPRVIQQNDEIKGEEIVFLNEGKEIQIKRARAKFEKDSAKKF